MQVDWQGHQLEVRGDWPARWLYLAPEYILEVDGTEAARSGGPVVRPHLEAMFEDEEGELHHLEAELLSIVGFRPRCQISVDGDPLETRRVPVRNVLNPFLALIILVSTAIMLYLGPDVLRLYWPG
jgi:hypothetical protein